MTEVRTVALSIRLPKVEVRVPRGTITINGNLLTLKGSFTSSEAQRLAMAVEDNFWEYQTSLVEKENYADRFLRAVEGVHPRLAGELRRGMEEGSVSLQFDYIRDILTVTLKPEASELAGRLIGRQGATVKKLQDALGVRVGVRVEEPAPSEEDLLRQKLQEMVRRLTG